MCFIFYFIFCKRTREILLLRIKKGYFVGLGSCLELWKKFKDSPIKKKFLWEKKYCKSFLKKYYKSHAIFTKLLKTLPLTLHYHSLLLNNNAEFRRTLESNRPKILVQYHRSQKYVQLVVNRTYKELQSLSIYGGNGVFSYTVVWEPCPGFHTCCHHARSLHKWRVNSLKVNTMWTKLETRET